MCNKIVQFNKIAIMEYLDNAIRGWRDMKVEIKGNVEEELVCACYIDAFQSMRISIFGEILPQDKKEVG